MSAERLYLRDEDLTAEERALPLGPEDQVIRRSVARLAGDLRALHAPPAPPLSRVRRRARWRAPALGALIAAGALAALLPGQDLRQRGAAGAWAADVVLEAAAEGHTLRALGDGDALEPGERVPFRVSTSRAGWLTLSEDGVVVTAEAVPAGSHALGGGHPLAWRADTPGRKVYRARLCDGPDRCVEDRLVLEWR